MLVTCNNGELPHLTIGGTDKHRAKIRHHQGSAVEPRRWSEQVLPTYQLAEGVGRAADHDNLLLELGDLGVLRWPSASPPSTNLPSGMFCHDR